MAGTPTKQYASAETGVCRTCNSNIKPKNHPFELFGPRATEERIAVFLEKVCGVKLSLDDGYRLVYAGFVIEKLRSFRGFRGSAALENTARVDHSLEKRQTGRRKPDLRYYTSDKKGEKEDQIK